MIESNDFTDTNLIKPVKKYAFVFVCQEGELEIKSLLLAASLKRFLKCDYELIAAVPLPSEKMGKPKKTTIELLKKMNVKIVNIYNDLIAKESKLSISLLFTNKIYCLKVPNYAEKLIFLDSDMLCHSDFFGDICFSIPFNAMRVGVNGTIPPNGKWKQIYEAVGIKMPKLRIKQIKKREGHPDFTFTPPYFNGGFIAINADLANNFCDVWLECYKKIRSKNLIATPFFIEQIALSLALHKMDIPYNILNLDYPNLPFFHYSNSKNIMLNKKLRILVKSLINEYPELKEIIRNNVDWQFMVQFSYTILRLKDIIKDFKLIIFGLFRNFRKFLNNL